MKTIGLFFFLNVFCLGPICAQIRFSKFYDYAHTQNLIVDAVILNDTGYFLASECVEFNQIDTLNFLKTYLYFIRTNEFGDTVFTKAYHRPRYNIDGGRAIKTNFGYYFIGNEFDLKKYTEFNYGSYVKLWKLNNFGDTLLTNNFDIQVGNEYVVKFIPTIDGGYAIFGQTCNQVESGRKCNYFLLKLDNNGNKLWHKIYSQNSTSFENPTSAIQLPDGSFYLFGHSTFNNVMMWFLVKTDSIGNIQWKKTYNEFPRQAGLSLNSIGENIILVGSYNSLANGTGKSQACAMLINQSGSKIWLKSYNGNRDLGFTDVQSGYENGKIYYSGINENYDSLNRAQGWLLATNLQGDSLYQRLYDPTPIWSEQIYSIHKTGDGFLMSGYGLNYVDSIRTQDAWLLKVDSFGCLTPGCQFVGLNNVPVSREEIKIFPNPATNNIKLYHSKKIISYRLADYTGKLLMDTQYFEEGIDIENLPNGNYIIQVLLEDNVQSFGKLTVLR